MPPRSPLVRLGWRQRLLDRIAIETFNQYKGKPESIIRSVMRSATGYPFYNLSKLELRPSNKGINSLLDDPNNLAPNLNSYINGFSPNVRAIMERFAFDQQIARMAEKNLLFKVVQKFHLGAY